MPPNPRRYARLVRSRRFLLAFGPLVLSLTLAAAVLIGGLFDDPLGLTGAQRGTADASLYDEPGAPTLLPWERLSLVGTLAGLGSAPTIRPLEAGVSGVSLVAAGCNDVAPAQQERSSGEPQHVTIHTSEENAGPAGVGAVCRYHSRDLGWGHAGYTYYIDQTGLISQLLPHATKPYAQMLHNDRDIAIALQGMSGRNVPSAGQRAALARLLPALKARYPSLQPGDLYGHRDWSNADQARVQAGTWNQSESLVNTHTDPAPADQWEGATPPRWNLGASFADATGALSPPGLGSYAVPALAVRSRFAGSATYYLPTGRPTASGLPYDGRAHTGAVWLLTRDQLADDDPRVRDCHDSPSLGQTICPALPFQAVLRVCRVDRPAVCTRVAIQDTGLMPGGGLDLSPLAFQELGPLREGRIAVTATVVGYLRP